MQQLNSVSIKKPQPGNGVGIFILCLLASLAAIFFLALPKYQEYSLVKAKAAASKNALELLKTQQQKVNDTLSKLQENSNGLQKIDQALPNQPDIPAIYAYMETMAKSLNLTLSAIQATDESDLTDSAQTLGVGAGITKNGVKPVIPAGTPSNVGTIDVSMQVKGLYSDYVNFLSKLQNSLRLIDVKSIDVNSDGKGALTFITTLKTYYLKNQ